MLELPQIAEGSEHRVFLDAERALVYKATRPGQFGESYYLDEGKVFQKNCMPIEYLARLRLWRFVFGSAPASLGMTSIGQFVTSHEFITGELPTQNEVDTFLKEVGFTPIRQQYWLWKKVYRPTHLFRLEVEIGDARDENFVKTQSGIVPIDIRLWALNKRA